MKSPTTMNQELRQRILNLSGVTERSNAGIHEDAFFVGRTMFMHIHGAAGAAWVETGDHESIDLLPASLPK